MKSKKVNHCANCGTPIHGTKADPNCHSGLFGSHGIILCKSCMKIEDTEIDKAGTNDIPDLLKRYKKRP